ncbi:class I SAM-dependent methyltransferase [Paroceanicella profunda]|uniref:Class I SAM-dependent methyltransferase n=1 Tax=Paroceanicella profunda TaxID=2579971 RepID=A0A5B8FV34_9RHOB|nr:cyclopropane-fatty-acyl-phospholipid synthase family protein [Paroceanicella profunda]QDL90930.1 class I SAM-dependent methyltransferase [Paroceanicella profunda]
MKFLPRLLSRIIRAGTLTLTTPNGRVHEFRGSAPGPHVKLRITDPSLDWKIFFSPELAGAEAYMDGTLIVEDGDAYSLLQLIFLNKGDFDNSPGQRFWYAIGLAFRRYLQYNPLSKAKKNAGHHYNTGNDFYRMWLDEDMQYSCAYFPTGQETLEQAQVLKKRHIAAKLGLAPGQKVLDIGCGWGGMALYLAAVADVEVTGVTLAEEQLKIAQARAKAAGLEDRVTFELRDYRNITETYDRVVSVGMLEHVGVTHLGEYFRKVQDVLKPDGVALIHSISSRTPPSVTGPFLRKYIFPGGYAPSVSEAMRSVEESGLWLLDSEIWRVHYAPTLMHWRQRFMARRDEAVARYDERFARMWEFYLAACECAFRYGDSHVFQFQLGRDRAAMPLHRDYVAGAAATLAAREAEAIPRINAATRSVFGETGGVPHPAVAAEFENT